MRASLLAAAFALAATGCAALSLQRNTLRQTESLAGLRYQMVMDDLAAVAENSEALPAYASIVAGTSLVSDMGTATAVTTLDREQVTKGVSHAYFASQSLDLMGQRKIASTWTLDPVAGPERLKAIRAACRWGVYGPQALSFEDRRTLSKYCDKQTFATWDDYVAAAGYYFDVEEILCRMPAGWLRVGCRADVPHHAAHVAHSGNTWVWVEADGVEALSLLTVAVHTISRTAADSVFHPDANVRTITKSGPVGTAGATVKATVYVDQFGNLVPTADGYAAGYPFKKRLDDLGASPFIRSTVAATAAANR